jgi:magnesium chelatase family protein
VGPPGSGKVRWARDAACAIHPRTFENFWPDVRGVYRATEYSQDARPLAPPLRAPHHTVSLQGLMGRLSRGWDWRPGELSLAHGGVLLLDEVFEFRQEAVEAVAGAWRAGRVTLTSERETRWFPAEFRLVMSCNPCPCGFLGSEGAAECDCSEALMQRHRERIAWLVALVPGLERIDLPARKGGER